MRTIGFQQAFLTSFAIIGAGVWLQMLAMRDYRRQTAGGRPKHCGVWSPSSRRWNERADRTACLDDPGAREDCRALMVGREGSSRIEFAVRDSGRGIPSDKITTLFQPLRKESGRRGQLFSQAGLGLTICRKLATAMKSELKVESRTGWGTRFFFELDLPIVAARRSGPRAAPRATGAHRHPVRNSGSHAPRGSGPKGRPSS